MAIRRAKSLPPTIKTVIQRFVPLPAVGKINHITLNNCLVINECLLNKMIK